MQSDTISIDKDYKAFKVVRHWWLTPINPSYLGFRGQENCGLRSARGKY
jgi:hypothetical protein